MAATATSRIGSGLLKSQPFGYDVRVEMEDSSAASIIPAFTLIGTKADGYGEIAAANVAYALVGIATEETDVSDDAADGDTILGIRHGCVVLMVASGLTIADVGSPVFIVDNQTVTVTDPVDATPQIGHITEFVSATSCYVKLADIVTNP
ncbi:MAG: hypothetical protein KAJ19_09595 [Gammaproteobacteria bacterium]|nr:hypothetical protein [Gammaproteobacteria bacterium]